MSVELHFNGRQLDVKPGDSLFDCAESAGIQVPTSCRKNGKCKECVVEIAEGIGAKGGMYGCRMTGGGFGGCAVALVKTELVEAISEKIAADYKKLTRIEATIFVSRPAAGATVIKA